MPSLMENVGLVAMEAMINGIPVLGSTRGALPETIGGADPDPLPADAATAAGDDVGHNSRQSPWGAEAEAGGFLLNIPPQYTPETRLVPTAEEVEPWVSTIVRLWDDAREYQRWSEAARERSRLWQPEHLGPIYREFFSSLRPQSGPPLAPKDAGQQAFPPLSTQAWSLARSVAAFVADGFRTVDAGQYRERLGVCGACDRLSGHRCTECGCWVALKARGRTFTCPLGRWPQ
jgi:hypothetical protein